MKKLILRFIGSSIICMLAIFTTTLNPSLRIDISLVIGLISFILLITSRIQIGKAFAVTPKAKALVTKGIFSKIQHPMFLFIDLFLSSVIVFLNIPYLFIAWGVLVIFQLMQTQKEEKVLSDAFGEQYKTYIAHTWI